MSIQTILLGVIALLAVFLQGSFDGVRQILGVQPELLPSLIVYAALSGTLGSVALVAVGGGLLLDSLSANPLGVSVVPLFLAGIALHAGQELIMKREIFAQMVLGAAASTVVPVLVLISLLTGEHVPVVGWGTLWQLAIIAAFGALLTPFWFIIFDWLHLSLAYDRATGTSFRPDREIRRGK
jgi:rod shape-determining protein MreD